MAKQETLQAEKRDTKGTTASKKLRREGNVPAVVYGSKQDAYTIQVNSKNFFDLFKRQTSENFLVNLEIEGANEKSKLAFVQDIQRDPLSGNLVHVDFRAVSEDENIRATIPVHLEGESVGVKSGGLLEHLLHSLEIECRPGDLPDHVSCDIEHLEIGDAVKVGDIEFPDGVSTSMGEDVLVALVAKQRTAEEPGATGEGEEGAEGAAEGEGGEGEGDAAEGASGDADGGGE